jgi:hypothetical protein
MGRGIFAPMAVEFVDRLATRVAVLRVHGMGTVDFRPLRSNTSLRMQYFVELLLFLFSNVFGDVRREFMQRLLAALHGTLDSYIRDALHEGSANAVACLLIPRAYTFPPFFFLLGGLRIFL